VGVVVSIRREITREAELCFDLASPFTYLLAERVDRAFDTVTWTPVSGLRSAGDARTRSAARRRAAARRLPLVWPERWPAPVPTAMQAAAAAAAAGRGGAFVVAASRLAFAGGWDLEDPAVLAEAAAAAGLDPDAVASGHREPPRASLACALPALRVGDVVHAGEAAISATLAAVRWGRAAGSWGPS